MAFVSVTNMFVDGTTITAAGHNTNFNDIINGLSDGTKTLNMSAATFSTATITTLTSTTLAGNPNFTGNVSFAGTLTASKDKGRIQAWINKANGNNTTITDSMNVTSVTRNGVGDYTVNLSITMANTTYCVLSCIGSSPNGTVTGVVTRTATTCRINMTSSAGATDSEFFIGIVGSQA